MIYVWIILFVLAVIVAWIINLFGLPGNWMVLLLVALWVWIGPQQEPFDINWKNLIVLLGLALAGELVEFGASFAGTQKLGGSKWGGFASLVGSIIGAILGAIIGLPIPVIGWIIGSVLFASVGAMIGATIAEKMVGKPVKTSLKIGGAAFIGRMLGTVGKISLGSVMVMIAILSLFF